VIVYAFTGILTLSNMLLALAKKHSKVIAIFLLLFMWLLFWGNTMNPDYEAYSNLYSNIQYGVPMLGKTSIEPGFILIMKLCSLIGLNYTCFLALTTLCCYSMIHSTVKLYYRNYNYVYLLYFIYPFFIDVIQIRNFIVMSILIYSVRFLVMGGINGKIRYTILLLLAATIHRVSLVYLPMILIRPEKKNYLIYCLATCSLLFSILFLLNNKEIPIFGPYIENFIGQSKYLSYFNVKARWGSVLFCYLQLSSFIMIMFSKRLYYKYNRYLTTTYYYDANRKYINIMYYINLLLTIYMPLFILNVSFTRIIRNIILLNYIAFSNVSDVIDEIDVKILYNMCVIIYVLVFFIILIIPQKEDIIMSVINNNIIYNLLR